VFPFRGSSRSELSAACRQTVERPFLELSHSSAYQPRQYRRIGWAIPLRRYHRPWGIPTETAMGFMFIQPVLPLVSLLSPSKNSRLYLAAQGGSTSPGVWSPSALSATEARSTQACLTWHLPPSGFLTLLTVYFLRYLPALFHAGHAHGVLPPGLFPPDRAFSPSRSWLPSWRWSLRDRNRGSSSPSGSYSLPGSVTSTAAFDHREAATLLVFPPSREFPRTALARLSLRLPSWACSRAAACTETPTALQGLKKRPGWLVSRETATPFELLAPLSDLADLVCSVHLAYGFTPAAQ